jgi:hypothetical protein
MLKEATDGNKLRELIMRRLDGEGTLKQRYETLTGEAP